MKFSIIPFLFFSITSAAQIINIERQRIITDTTGWSGDAVFNINAAKFTSSIFTTEFNSHVQYKNRKSLWLLFGNYVLFNGGNSTFDDRGFAHLRYNYELSNVLRAEAFTQIQYNNLLKMKARFLNGIGIRVKLSQYERAKFYYGLTYMYEFEELSNDFIRFNRDHRASTYFTFTLNPEENVTFRNTCYLQPLINNPKDYRLNNETQLIFAISKHIRLNTTFNYAYDANPPSEVPKSIFFFSNGLGFNF